MNIDLIKEKFFEMSAAIERAKNKNVVLVVTVTGGGSSTAYNYMNGIPLEERDGGKIDIAEHVYVPGLPSNSYSKIGHSGISETSTINASEIDDLVFIDTPGFFDTRIEAKEVEALKYLGLQMIARVSASIRGIVVLIDGGLLDVSRGQGLFHFTEKLSNLIYPDRLNVMLASNIIFAFNKEGKIKRSVDQIKNKLNALFEERIASQGYRQEDASAGQSVLNMIDAIRNGEIMKLDVLDNGFCRYKILSFMQDAPIHDKSLFPLVRERNHFNTGLQFTNQISRLYLDFIQEKRDLESKILDINEKTVQLRDFNKEYMESLVKGDYLDREYLISLYRNEIAETKSVFSSLKKRNEKLLQNIRLQEEKVTNIKNDKTEITVFDQQYCEYESLAPVKKGVINTHVFVREENDDSLYDYRVKTSLLLHDTAILEGTDARVEEKSKTKNKIEIKYSTPSHYYGKAHCVMLSLRCDLQHSKDLIKNHQESILILKSEIDDLVSEMGAVSEKIDDLEIKCKTESNDAERDLRKKIHETENEIRKNNEISDKCNQRVKYIEEQITLNEDKFCFLKTVIQHVIGSPWPGSPEDEFLRAYSMDGPIAHPEGLIWGGVPRHNQNQRIDNLYQEDEKSDVGYRSDRPSFNV